METIEKLNSQNKHFSEVADHYYNARKNINHLTFKKLLWSDFFKKNSFIWKNNLKTLEAMCGYAEGKSILENYLSEDIDYEGFDYCDNLIEKAKSMYPSIKIYKMDVTKFKSDKLYDLILIIGSLHHVPDHASSIIKNLKESLTENGHMLILEPTHNNFIFKKVREGIYAKNKSFDNLSERVLELNELNKIFKDSDLKIVDQLYPGLLSFILYYNPEIFPYLNIGTPKTVEFIYNLEKLFYRNIIGKKLSFATLTLLKKKS